MGTGVSVGSGVSVQDGSGVLVGTFVALGGLGVFVGPGVGDGPGVIVGGTGVAVGAIGSSSTILIAFAGQVPQPGKLKFNVTLKLPQIPRGGGLLTLELQFSFLFPEIATLLLMGPIIALSLSPPQYLDLPNLK